MTTDELLELRHLLTKFRKLNPLSAYQTMIDRVIRHVDKKIATN